MTPWRRVWLWYWRRRRDRLVRLADDESFLRRRLITPEDIEESKR